MIKFLLQRLPCARVAAIVGGTMLVGSYLSSSASADAATQAASTQAGASANEIAERQRQFNVMKDLLNPWVQEGQWAQGKQEELIGRFGYGPQADAIEALRTGPQMAALTKTGENAILSNASATGGLRGGNVNAALAQYDQSILSGLIDQQYSRLSGINQQGQNAAAGVGSAAINMGNANAGSIGDAGAAAAGGILGAARATNGFYNTAVNAAGVFTGYGGGSGIRMPGSVTTGAPMIEAGTGPVFA